MNSPIKDIDEAELAGLKNRLEEAQAHDLALSGEDKTLLSEVLDTLAFLQERLSDKETSLHKLRKLLGIQIASEKLRDLVDTPAGDGDEGEDQGVGKGSTSASRKGSSNQKPIPALKPRVEHHALEGLNKGEACSSCERGVLYKYEPARLLRITGSTPFEPVQHLSQRLRCNACGEFSTAALPAEVQADGEANQKYGYSARSLITLNKYFGGTPFYRQQSLQHILGVPMTASTAFDQCELVADAVQPVFQQMQRESGDAVHFHLDDTANRIVDQKPVKKKKRNSEQEQLRSGIYSSGVIAELDDGHEVVLFKTNIGHAGELIDELLARRTPGLAPPLIMSDALSHNRATATPTVQSLCNAHGRRQFVDVMPHFPDEVEPVLEAYAHVWRHETKVLQQEFSPAERLAYHRTHSLPIMERIRDWGNDQLATESVEANSGLGKAIRYFDKHFEGLTRFCTREGARLDNNAMERQLKLVVRNRKNANFFKSAVGAAVGDVLTSVIATAAQAGVNVFDYLNALQRNKESVKAHPERWLPWHFEPDTS